MLQVRVLLLRFMSLSVLFYILDNATGKIYILMESRLITLYKSDSEYEVLDRQVHKLLHTC